MIEFALGTWMKTRTAITAIVGQQVYGDKAPQAKNPPFIQYQITGGTPFYHSEGASNLAEAFITIVCRDTTYAKSRTLYEVVRNEVDGFSGTWGATAIRSAFLSLPNDIGQPGNNGSDAGENAVTSVLTVMYRRAVPTFGA